MVNKAYALSREQIVKTLIAYEGYTTAAGAAGGTSLIDANLIGVNDFLTSHAILILDGVCANENQPATAFNVLTGEITTGAFTAQIAADVHFRVLNISSVELDVLNLLTRIGASTDPAGTTTIFAWLLKIWNGMAGNVVGTGTLTTSSTTVPADTARAEANNYWDGCWLMPLTGAIAFQPKKIVSFANAGGVFTLDGAHPFTAVPGLVTYAILRPTDDLVPAVGYSSSTTPAHVIGNKADLSSFNTDDASIIYSLMSWIRGVARAKMVLTGNAEAGSDASNIISAASLNQAAGFWIGQHVLMVSGNNMRLSRPIVAFDAATDKITVSPAFPNAVASPDQFVILSNYTDPLATQDGAVNLVPADVTGNKADAAVTTVGAVASIIAYVKGLLNQVVIVLSKTNLILPGNKIVTKTSTSTLTTGTLFTWAGSVQILSIIGRVTTVIQSQATTVKLGIQADALTIEDMCATLDINGFVVGTMLGVTGNYADAMVGVTGKPTKSPTTPFNATCITSGIIKVTYGAASSGAIVWEILWVPLNAAGSIVAA